MGSLLRETYEDSNYVLLNIPIEIHLVQRGLQRIDMDPGRLSGLLGNSELDIESLWTSLPALGELIKASEAARAS